LIQPIQRCSPHAAYRVAPSPTGQGILAEGAPTNEELLAMKNPPQTSAPSAVPYPQEILELLERHHSDGVTEKDCLACPAACCSQGGFAILENVLLIYEHYRTGQLQRRDFTFPTKLSLSEFVYTFFDLTSHETGSKRHQQEILFFHMKSLSSDGQLITIPAVGEYYEVRSRLFEDNPWLSRGCVFLNRQHAAWDSEDHEPRHCLLHVPDSERTLTRKPIDCVFFTCNEPLEARLPDEEQSDRWFHTLAVAFPDSVRRFRELSR
jgi:hypothetical protein